MGICKHLRVQSPCVFFSTSPLPFVVKRSLVTTVLHRCTSASEVLDRSKSCDRAQPRLPEVDSTFSLFHELQFLHAALDLVRSLVIVASWLQQLLQGGRWGGVGWGVSGGIGGGIVKLRSILGLEGESESLLEKEQSGSEVEQVWETGGSRGSSPLSTSKT